MNRPTRRRAVTAAAILCLAAATTISACAQRTRPLEASLADEMLRDETSRTGVLDFFDALENRSTICHDDAVTGVLLAKRGSAPGGPDASARRFSAARDLGFVPPDYDPAPRDVATTGDVARLVVAAARRKDSRRFPTADESMRILAAGGYMPKDLTGSEPATGIHLLTALTGLSEIIAAGGIDLAEPTVAAADDTAPLGKSFPELGLAPDEPTAATPPVAAAKPQPPAVDLVPSPPPAPPAPPPVADVRPTPPAAPTPPPVQQPPAAAAAATPPSPTAPVAVEPPASPPKPTGPKRTVVPAKPLPKAN